MKMDLTPGDFKRFVHFIESKQPPQVQIAFKSVKELECSATYFFERAVLHPDISSKFAQAAAKLYFVTPIGTSEPNFRKVLIAESQIQLERLHLKLNSASNVTLERALGIFKFFGELYNVGFIFKGIVKKHVDILAQNKHECFISNRCFYLLLSTVKERVVKASEEDYSSTIRSLLEIIEDAENNPSDPPSISSPIITTVPKLGSEQFPALNELSEIQKSESLSSFSPEEKLMLFKQLLEQLLPINVQEVIQKIDQNVQLCSDDGTWQLYYESLIEKALSNHDLAGPIVEICQKLSRSNSDAWQGVKSEDYKKHVHGLINTKLEDLFKSRDENLTKSQAFGILKFVEKLLDHSLCSIGNIASFVDVLIRCSKSNGSLASLILLQYMLIVKVKVKSVKIRKMPKEVRKSILTTISVPNDGKQSKNFLIYVKVIAEYLDVERNDMQNADGENTEKMPHRIQSSPTSSCPPTFVAMKHEEVEHPEISNYSEFIDKIAIMDMDLIEKSIGYLHLQEFDFKKLAQTLFESLTEGNIARFIFVCTKVEHRSGGFNEILWSCALNSVATELPYDDETSFKKALVAVEFITKYRWHNDNNLFQLMDEIASTDFKQLNRVKIFMATLNALEFRTLLMMRHISPDRFNHFLKIIRLRLNGADDFKSHWTCQKLIEMLESIHPNNGNRIINQNYIANNRLDLVVSILDSLRFTNLGDCVRNIKFLEIKTIDELSCLVEGIIHLAMKNLEQVGMCAELVSMLDGLSVKETSFQVLLIDRCQHKFFDLFLRPLTPSEVSGLYCFVQFVSDLFNLKMVNREFTHLCMDVFFRNETNSLDAVRCINIMMRTIGPKLDENGDTDINRYFVFFQNVIDRENKTLRSLIYKALIDLRNTNWDGKMAQTSRQINPEDENTKNNVKLSPNVVVNEGSTKKVNNEKNAETKNACNVISQEPNKDEMKDEMNLIIDIESFDDEDELESIATELKQRLTSSSRVKNLIGAFLSRPSLDHRHISTLVKLFKELADLSVRKRSGEEITFKECLIQALNSEFIKSSSKRMLDEVTKNFFSFLIILVGELYRQEIFADDDLSTWLLHKHIKLVPLEHLTYLSSIIAPKVQLQGDKHVKMILGMLETSIHDSAMEMCFSIKEDLAIIFQKFQNF